MPVVALILLAVSLAFGQDTFSGVGRVVAVGDVHGGYDEFVAILKMAGLVDGANKWTGGKTHLVQTGDVPDRGPDTRKVMDLLMELEKQAKKAGGQVHALIGNHDAMMLYGDLRYVSAGEYESFRTDKSAEMREEMMKANAPDGKVTEAIRRQWDKERPLGWIEHRRAFSPDGKYGQWILKHNAVVKINDTLFLHGGIGPKYAQMKLKDINNKIREELRGDPAKLEGGATTDPEGVLWYRGLAQLPEAERATHVDAVLAFHGAARIVVAHTPTSAAVLPRVGAKVIMIDVGLSKLYGGPPACLVIENGKAQALHRGKLLALPVDAAGLAQYVDAIKALEPAGSPVISRLEKLATGAVAADQ